MTESDKAKSSRARKAKAPPATAAAQDSLDEALASTFPASDPVAAEQPVIAGPAPPPEVAKRVHAEEAKQHRAAAKPPRR